MTKFSVQATESSPRIEFDPEALSFEITGKSHPDNCRAFYGPMFDWLEKFFAQSRGDRMELDMEILNLNGSSTKTFTDLFDLLEKQADRGRKIVVNWRYHEQNAFAMECGEEFMEDVSNITFNLMEFTDQSLKEAV